MRYRSLALTLLFVLSFGLNGRADLGSVSPLSATVRSIPVQEQTAVTPAIPLSPLKPPRILPSQSAQVTPDFIPRTSHAPTLDGKCQPAEYDQAAKIWMNSKHSLFVYAISRTDALYLCTNLLFGPAASDANFTIYINRDGQDRTTPGPSDVRYKLTPDGRGTASIGNGSGYTGAIPTLISTGIITGNDLLLDDETPPLPVPWWSVEIRLPFIELAPFKLGETLHMALQYKGFVADPSLGGIPWSDYIAGNWPETLNEQAPSSWGTIATLGHDLFLPLTSKSHLSTNQLVTTVTHQTPAHTIAEATRPTTSAHDAVRIQSASQPSVLDYLLACPLPLDPRYFFDKEAKWPMVDPNDNPFIQVEGTLKSIRVSPEDSPAIHDSHDADMKMEPAANGRWAMIEGDSELVLESEGRRFPSFARPMPEDHVTVAGRWIFDCGHAPKTEVHPTPFFESDRFELRRVQPNAPLQKVRVVRIWMNSNPGAFSYFFDPQAPFNFRIELPPGAAKPFIGYVSGDAQFLNVATNGGFADVQVRPQDTVGQWYWEFIVGRNVPENVSDIVDSYTVHLNKIDVNNDRDHGIIPDCHFVTIFDIPTHDCGEWTMNIHMHGIWRDLTKNGSWGTIFDKTTVDEDDGPYDIAVPLPVTGDQLEAYIEGYDDDDPLAGDDISNGTWQLGRLTDLCCDKPQVLEGGDWTLFYTVTKEDNRPLPVDQDPPTTLISLPPLPAGGWYLKDVLVTVSATDDISGVAGTQCRINGGDWFAYSIPFTVSKEGFNDSVECYSRDQSGKVEQPKVATFNLDKFPPASALLVTGQVYGSIGDVTYIGRHHTLALYAQDTVFGSDALQVEYRMYKDGTLAGAFSSPSPNGTTFSLPIESGGVGLWHVDYRAADPVHTFDTLAPDAFQTKSFFISARVQDGLIAFYPFSEGGNTIVHDYSWNGTPLDLEIGNPSAASWVPGGLTINTPTVLASSLPATKVTKAVSDTNELTLEAWIQPSQPVPEEPASIITLATDTISRNVTLSQLRAGKSDRVRYDMLLRTSKTSRKGSSLRSDQQTLVSTPVHLVYTRDALGLARLYLNGIVEQERSISGRLAAWGDVRLALANELSGGAPWLGTYRLVAFYNRALSPAEVRQNFLGGPAGNGNTTTPAELQTLYRFNEGSGSVIRDQAGATPPLNLQIANPIATSWITSGLAISTATLVSSSDSATRLTHAVTGTNEVSLEAWITPAARQPETLARIFTLSNDPVRRNIELLQEREEGHTEPHFTVRTRTTETESSAKPPLESPNNSARPMLQHVVFTRDALGLERIYINGVKVADRTFDGDFSTWDGSYRLALGNTLSRDRPWLGIYHQVAVYNRALSPAEIGQHYLTGSGH